MAAAVTTVPTSLGPDGTWVNQQTMLRIKEPKRSLDFYQRILGMTLVKQLDFPQWGFSLYFMGYLPKVH